MTEVRLYVIDTGCLLEFFKVDQCFKQEISEKVVVKFKDALEKNDRIYVPQPVLFECANHIAQIKNIKNKEEIANKFVKTIQASISDSNPWIITHPSSTDSIESLVVALKAALERFTQDIENNSFSLVDVVVINEANRLKESHKSDKLKKQLVHIWTTEHAVKAYEPDKEPDPFI